MVAPGRQAGIADVAREGGSGQRHEKYCGTTILKSQDCGGHAVANTDGHGCQSTASKSILE